MRVIHGAHNSLGLLRFIEAKTRVNGANGVVEFGQKVVGIIETAVDEDIDLGRFKNANSLNSGVEFVDIADLLPEVLNGDTTRDFQALRVVGDSQIFVATLP